MPLTSSQKKIIEEWIEKADKAGEYTNYYDGNLENVTLDGGFNLEELAEKLLSADA